MKSVSRGIEGTGVPAGGSGAMPVMGGDPGDDGQGSRPGGEAADGRRAARVPLRQPMDDRLLDALLDQSRDEAGGRIDPRECREQAARRFTPAVMAARYADLYEQLISGIVPRAVDKAVPDRVGWGAGRTSGSSRNA